MPSGNFDYQGNYIDVLCQGEFTQKNIDNTRKTSSIILCMLKNQHV